MGKLWESYGKVMGKLCASYARVMRNLAELSRASQSFAELRRASQSILTEIKAWFSFPSFPSMTQPMCSMRLEAVRGGCVSFVSVIWGY